MSRHVKSSHATSLTWQISLSCMDDIATKCIMHRNLMKGIETIRILKHKCSKLLASLSVLLCMFAAWLKHILWFLCCCWCYLSHCVSVQIMCLCFFTVLFLVFVLFYVSCCKLLTLFSSQFPNTSLFSFCQAVIMKTTLLIDLLN